MTLVIPIWIWLPVLVAAVGFILYVLFGLVVVPHVIRREHKIAQEDFKRRTRP